mgnify:CR=1 FL=1
MSIILGSNVWTKDLGDFELGKLLYSYHKVTSSNMFCFEAHAGLFGLLMKGIFMLFDLLAKKYFWFCNTRWYSQLYSKSNCKTSYIIGNDVSSSSPVTQLNIFFWQKDFKENWVNEQLCLDFLKKILNQPKDY